jgi:membrane protein
MSSITTMGIESKAQGDIRGTDEEPHSPTEVSSPGRTAAVKQSLARAKANRVPMMAGSIAYHSFLALFPAIIALIGLTQLVGVSPSFITKLVHGIGKALPQGASTVLTDALESAHHRTSGALLTILLAIAIAVWSASSGMNVLQTGLDVAYEVPSERRFVANRLTSLLLLVVVGTLGGVAATLIVFASPLGSALQPRVGLSPGAFRIVWTIVRWAVTVAVLLVLMASVYRLAPNRQSPGWQWLSPGGLFATVVWLVASVGLSFYVSSLGSYAKTYGALAGVVVLMLWLYVTAYIVLFGGQLNAEMERQAVIEGGETGSGPRRDQVRPPQD